MPFSNQNLLLLNPTERYLTEQSLNHPAFQPLRQAERERPPPASPNPPRSSKRKTHHHGENTVPTRLESNPLFQASARVSTCGRLTKPRLDVSVLTLELMLCYSDGLFITSNVRYCLHLITSRFSVSLFFLNQCHFSVCFCLFFSF